MTPPLLELQGISKRFPGVIALSGVNLSVGQGEVHALIGENGAGKSTLMKILGGVHRADAGTISIDGKPATIRSVGDAARHGIAFIHQELNVFDNLDVAANIFLGREPLHAWAGPLRLIDRRAAAEASLVHLKRLGLDIDPHASLATLSLAQQQMVEIAKALSQDARLIIMDEPTSSLTLTETDRLLTTVRELRNQGVSVIYISHRLNEIQQCADRVTALRDGRNSGNLEHEQINHAAMVRLMIGRDLEERFERGESKAREGGLIVRGVRTQAHPQHAIDLRIARGEILGLAGLVGAGRTELARAIFGVEPPRAGELELDGKALRIRSAREAIDAGIYLVPEDRRSLGLITEMSVRENITLPSLAEYAKGGLIGSARERETARRGVEALRVKTTSIETRAATLSGGNQQKVVLAKWLTRDPKVMIFDEPTRGIDVGAKSEIYHLMRELAGRGVAILMISSDMEEVLGVSDRVAVMHEGRLMGVLDCAQATEEAVMLWAVGQAAKN